MNRRFRSLVLLLSLLAPTALMRAQTTGMAAHFEYDTKAPILIRQIGVEKRGDVSIRDITYESPKGGPVPAYLVLPKGRGPFAAVIWGHWYWPNSPMRNREEFLEEAIALAQAGLVSLLTDGPISRPGHVESTVELNEQQVTDLVQQVTDLRRGVDLLLARKDVDPKRIGFVGHSYNAMVGGILRGVERRLTTLVLMAGSLSDVVDLKSEEYQRYRQKVGAEKFDAFVAKYAWTDPGNYVSRPKRAPVFLQFATQETFLTADRARLYEAVVSEPKRFKLYEAPHALNAEARRDRIAFLTEKLKLEPLPASVIAGIPDLYQPPPQN